MKILKALLGILGFAPVIVMAAWETGWTDNWLVGISGGYADREGQVTVNTSYTGTFLRQNLSTLPVGVENSGLNDTGIIWGILVGYQSICHKWLVGLELNADRQSLSHEHKFAFNDAEKFLGWNGDARYQRKMTAGLTTRIGYAVRSNFMPYLRGGVEIGDDRLKTFYYNPMILNGLPAFNEQSQWVWRFLLGAGVEFPVFPQCGITLRAEYDYHSKGKTLQNTGTLFTNGITILFASQAQPRMSSGRLSLIWNFF